MKHKMVYKRVFLMIKINHFCFFSVYDIELRNQQWVYILIILHFLPKIHSPPSSTLLCALGGGARGWLSARLPYLVAYGWVWPVRTADRKWEGGRRDRLGYLFLCFLLDMRGLRSCCFSYIHSFDRKASYTPVALTGSGAHHFLSSPSG